jgi:hypothetical protein
MNTDEPNGGSCDNGLREITGGTAFAGYNYNRAIGNINADGSVNSGSLRRASRFRANTHNVQTGQIRSRQSELIRDRGSCLVACNSRGFP